MELVCLILFLLLHILTLFTYFLGFDIPTYAIIFIENVFLLFLFPFFFFECKLVVALFKFFITHNIGSQQTVPIPSELSKLDSLSTQLIQWAKSYQTIVRLGTYTAKVLPLARGSASRLALKLTARMY